MVTVVWRRRMGEGAVGRRAAERPATAVGVGGGGVFF
jgi:hypothetical protein